nr:Origin of replication complex subunit 1A [Ipomoea batatas]
MNRRQLPTHPLAVVIYEALNGHRVRWKKALKLLNERFLNETERVLYNILDWPTKPHSRLTIIGASNEGK